MALWDLDDRAWFSRLNQKRIQQGRTAAAWWKYYDNEQPLNFIARILLEQEYRFPPLMLSWSELVVGALEERLDLDSFRLGDSEEASEELSNVWQWNDLDEYSGEAHLTALVSSGAYLMVGPGERYPRITVEYPDETVAEIDPATRQTVAALKVWSSDGQRDNRATLWLPGKVVEFEHGRPTGSPSDSWSPTSEQRQTSPLIPVIPLLNRPRKGCGQSELVAMKPLVDGANQTATNMMAGIEHHALHRKWAVGVSQDDFKDKDGKPIPAWKIATGAVWAVRGQKQTNRNEPAPPPVQLGQFAASDLRNFHDSIKQLAQLAAASYGLPPHYMGFISDNPASADAIRSSESRLIKRAERRQRTFGSAWERAMRIAWAMLGNDPAEAFRLEAVWRDPATPTRAATIEAAARSLESGLADNEQAREDAKYTAEQRRAMRQREAAARNRISDDVRALDVTGVPDAASILGGAGGPVPRQPAAGVPS